MTVRITHDPETSVYTHSKKAWSNSYPLSRLPEWIAFYKKQRQDFPRAGRIYDEDIEALEAWARRLNIPFE